MPKITELTPELTTVERGDYSLVVDAPTTAPTTKYVKVENYLAGPEIKVAASDASDNWKKHADYVCDGVADDVQIQAAITALGSSGGTLYLSPGTFYIAGKITILQIISIIGTLGTKLKATAVMDYVLGNETTISHLKISNLYIDGEMKAVKGLYLYYAHYCNIQNIRVDEASGDGIYAYCCAGAQFTKTYSVWNGDAGMSLVGCNASTLISCVSGYNTGNGIETLRVVIGATTWHGNCDIVGCISEYNTGYGIYNYNGTLNFSILGSWVEGNWLDGIRVFKSIGCITGTLVSNGTLETYNPDAYAIHLTSDGAYTSVVVDGCGLNAENDDYDYAQVKDDTGASYQGHNWIVDYAPIVREKSGAAASTADGGSIDHGLSSIPTKIIVTGSVAGEICTVSGITSAHFHVDIKKHDGTAGTTQTIYWRAEV